MIASRYTSYLEKYFTPLLGVLTERYNDKTTEQPFLHKQFLREEFSPRMTWGSTSLSHAVVAADVVSLNSSLPLKSRGSLSTASGEIPKLGVKYQKDEKFIQELEMMKNSGRANEKDIAAKVLDDVPNAVKAIETRKEIMFLQALSSGQTLTSESEDTGLGVRVDFGYKEANKCKAIKAAWSQATATPQDDVQQLFDKAEEDSLAITHLFISKKYFNLWRNSEQGKMLAATYAGQVVVDKKLLPLAPKKVFIEAVEDEFGCKVVVVNSTFKIQKADGTMESISPWTEGNIVGVTQAQIGRVVYSTLAEETSPVAGVKYEKSGTHILVSRYGANDPLCEFTSAQALCLPVIDGGDNIYLLDASQT